MARSLPPLLVLSLALGLSACGDDDLPPPIETGRASGPAGVTAVDWGSMLFASQGCPACHAINGNPSVGGPLDRIWGRTRELEDGRAATVDEDYLRRSILDPEADVVAGYAPSMPAYRGLLDDAELGALVAFLRQLR